MQTTTITTKATEGRRFYAEEIPDAWVQMIAATRSFGFALVSSRIDLPASQWRDLVTNDLPFDLAVACRLVKGVQGQQIPGGTDIAGAYCFTELIHLVEPVFRFGLDRGIIRATCSPDDLSVLKKLFKVASEASDN